MKKILNGCILETIEITKENVFLIDENKYYIYNHKNQETIFTSNKIKDISTVLYNETKDAILVINTTGCATIYENDIPIFRFKTITDPTCSSVFSIGKEFFFIDRKNILKKVQDNRISTVLEMKNAIEKVFRIKDTVFLVEVLRHSAIDPLNVTSNVYVFPILENDFVYKNYIFCDEGFIDNIKSDFNSENIAFLFDNPKGIGRRQEIQIFSISNFQKNELIDIDEIEKEICSKGRFVDYLSNVENGTIALLWTDCFIIYDFINKMVVFKISLENAANLIQIKEDEFLIATWEGLYNVKIQSSKDLNKA